MVDDIDAKITHVIRGEDHVTNSGAQIEIFQALSDHLPLFAHTPLLVGKDGKGLSKRLGSLSMKELKTQGIEPQAVASLLAKIGTSSLYIVHSRRQGSRRLSTAIANVFQSPTCMNPEHRYHQRSYGAGSCRFPVH